MEGVKRREQNAEALLGFDVAHKVTNLTPRLNRPKFEQILIRQSQQPLATLTQLQFVVNECFIFFFGNKQISS